MPDEPIRCALCEQPRQSVMLRQLSPHDLIYCCASCAVRLGIARIHEHRQHPPLGKPAPLTEEQATIVRQYLKEMVEERVCPVCHQPLLGKHQVGDAVIAVPCEHVIYHGKAQLHSSPAQEDEPENYSGEEETAEILADPQTRRDLQEALDDIAAGRIVPFEPDETAKKGQPPDA